MVADLHLIVNEIDLAGIGDEWEALVSAGQMIAEAHDRNRWALGDLGLKVQRRYGEDSIGSYGAAINVRPSTMYDYVACSGFYDVDARAQFPPLTWSHFRAAMKAGALDVAMSFLAHAADNNWSVDELLERIRVKTGESPRPKKLIELGAEYADLRPRLNAEGEMVAWDIVFRVDLNADSSINGLLELRRVYTLKVFGVLEGESDDAL